MFICVFNVYLTIIKYLLFLPIRQEGFADFASFSSPQSNLASGDSLSILDSSPLSSTPAMQSLPSGLPPLVNPAAISSPMSPPFSASQSPMVSPVNNAYQPVMGAPIGLMQAVPGVSLAPQMQQPVMMSAQLSSLPPNNMVYPLAFMGNGIFPQVSMNPNLLNRNMLVAAFA